MAKLIIIPFDRDEIYAAIWPELIDDIAQYAAEEFMGCNDRIRDAEADSVQYLLGEIEGNAATRTEAVSMALDLMRQQPDADYYDGFAPLWYVVIPSAALKPIHALLATTPNAARLIGDAVYFEQRAEADCIGCLFDAEVIGISLADPAPPPPQLRQLQRLAAKQRDAGYYSKHSRDQMIDAIIGRASTGELISEYEQDVLRELEREDDETAEDRHPC